ncbi:MAG TPA: hypothetical protein VMX74_04615 [Pirellulales bacterium]|nr:hypothetical protein [Pirellulales bacterium]
MNDSRNRRHRKFLGHDLRALGLLFVVLVWGVSLLRLALPDLWVWCALGMGVVVVLILGLPLRDSRSFVRFLRGG